MDAEECRVEAVNVFQNTAHRDVARITAKRFGHLRIERRVGEGADGVATFIEHPPQRRDVASARETSGHADDGDRLTRIARWCRYRQRLFFVIGRDQPRGERRHRRITEHAQHRHVKAVLGTQSRYRAQCQQRTAAQFKKIIEDANLFEPQHLCPHSAQRSFLG